MYNCECGNCTENKTCDKCGLVLDSEPDYVIHEFDPEMYQHGNLTVKTHEILKMPESASIPITLMGMENNYYSGMRDHNRSLINNQRLWHRLRNYISNERFHDAAHVLRRYISEISVIAEHLNLSRIITRAISIMFRKGAGNYKSNLKTHFWMLYCIYANIRIYKIPILTSNIISITKVYHPGITNQIFMKFVKDNKLKYYGIDFKIYWNYSLNRFVEVIAEQSLILKSEQHIIKNQLMIYSNPYIPRLKRVYRSDKIKSAVLLYNSIIDLRKKSNIIIPITQHFIANFFHTTEVSLRNNMKIIIGAKV